MLIELNEEQIKDLICGLQDAIEYNQELSYIKADSTSEKLFIESFKALIELLRNVKEAQNN